MRWDDDDVDGSSLNKNDKGGTLPDGIYNQNTKINFCCRTDGRKSHPVLLPTRDPFLLLAYGSENCQMVKGTVATQEWIHYHTETSSNADKSNGAIPYRGGQRHPTIHYCYYQGESESHRVTKRESYLNTIGFKAQSLWDRVEIKLIKSNLIKRRFLRRGENRSTRGKTTQGREENQQTLPTYDSEVGNRTQATVVGGECSHHYALAVSFKWGVPLSIEVFISGATIIGKKSREFLLFKRYLTPLFCPGL